MLATLTAVTFLVTGSAIALSPFLLDLARDLGATPGGGGQPGRRDERQLGPGVGRCRRHLRPNRPAPVLVAAVLTLGAARLGLALCHSYGAAGMWQLLAGVGGGGFMGTVFAAVSDRVPTAQRGRALGWVITGQSLSLVVGVPLVTLLGAFGGWRVAIAVHAGTALIAAVAVWLAVPGTRSLARRRAAPARVCAGWSAPGSWPSSSRTRWSARASRRWRSTLRPSSSRRTGSRCKRSPLPWRWWPWGTSRATWSAAGSRTA